MQLNMKVCVVYTLECSPPARAVVSEVGLAVLITKLLLFDLSLTPFSPEFYSAQPVPS